MKKSELQQIIKEELNEMLSKKKKVTIIRWLNSSTNDNDMDVKFMTDSEIDNFISLLKKEKIKHNIKNTGIYSNEPKIEYWYKNNKI